MKWAAPLLLLGAACVHVQQPPASPTALLAECRADEPDGLETGAYLVRVSPSGTETLGACFYFPKEPAHRPHGPDRPEREL